MQHPGLGHQAAEQGGQHHQQQEHPQVDPGPLGGGIPAHRHAAASPAQGHQGQGRPQLGGDQGPAQPVLQAGDGAGAAVAIGRKELHPAGAQVDQGKFPGGKEGQQGKQGCQGQVEHGLGSGWGSRGSNPAKANYEFAAFTRLLDPRHGACQLKRPEHGGLPGAPHGGRGGRFRGNGQSTAPLGQAGAVAVEDIGGA